ncbi:acyl carrier protein 1 [Quercus suber]|uniref:Acyl carrier protein 1 n=1 Tax=Quercus suber TaxID=58331 RepID=A0AAW0JN65_QUESU
MAFRAAILRRVRVPVKTLTLTGRKSQPWGSYGASLRLLSSHGDDHLSKDEVIERVLSVIKSFPKVDPSQVSPSFSLFHFLEKIPVWFATKQYFMCLILLLNR